jgi:hypothetical protein
MKSLLPLAAVGLVRLWTRVYSWGLPEGIRNARRAELESDLWECQQGSARTAGLPLEIIARLILGLPDDLGWRFEQDRARFQSTRTVAVIAGATTIVIVVWIGLAATPAELPPAPPAPSLQLRRVEMPPPPPPPPPPCNPPGIGRPAFSPCTPL